MPWNVQVGHENTQNYLQKKRNIKKNNYREIAIYFSILKY
jgi:hypothetical protein